MFKKLLSTALVITMIIGMGTTALAVEILSNDCVEIEI